MLTSSLFSTGDSGDSSLVVTLEINSVMYQGVLFAQNNQEKQSSREKAPSLGSSSNHKSDSSSSATSTPNAKSDRPSSVNLNTSAKEHNTSPSIESPHINGPPTPPASSLSNIIST